MDSSLEEIADKPGVLELIKALKDIAEKIERRPRLVGAIANPQTTHDAFYAMLFGEVDDLLFRIREFETTLATAGKNATDNMAEQTARLEAAIRQIMTHLQELVRTSGATASAKMKEAREHEEIELQRSVAASIDAAIDKAVSRAVGRFGEALKTLEVSATRAEQKVAAAAEASRPGWSALIAGVTALSALLGGLAGFLASRAF